MFYNPSEMYIFDSPLSRKAAEIFSKEIFVRTGVMPLLTAEKSKAAVIFENVDSMNKDSYSIEADESGIVFKAFGIRGFIFGIGHFLRKAVKSGECISLVEDISGTYIPDKSVRGHQLGYRTTPNTYDAWTYEQYDRYYLELMYFGVNTVEHIPYEKGASKRNSLMKYDEEEFLIKACEMADEYDLDVSLWHPNYSGETDESASERREKLYSKLKRLNYVFVPGGDPGNLKADVFISRCKAISKALKKVHPEAQFWPSAQQPHEYKDWGEVFIEELKKLPDEIDGIIFGPNHAFPLEELREKVPDKYPIRFYPDITHNVRCEYPVHYDKLDWHFALNTVLSRECTNPRPYEYAKLHHETSPYVIGSVSYSEGITDDVNKCIWSALDFNENTDVETAVEDYCRLYFYGCDYKKIADIILGLEKNWTEAPETNRNIDELFFGFPTSFPGSENILENWRYLQLYLRAVCDKYVKDKRCFDLEMIKSARKLLLSGDKSNAAKIINSAYPSYIRMLSEKIEDCCELMFRYIGYQSSVEKYDADNWERGAILNTYNLPVSDRQWLASLFKDNNIEDILKAFNRTSSDGKGAYYSVAYDGLPLPQDGEVYMNFQGDRPDVNNGTLSTALFNVYDNYSFKHKFTGLKNSAYKMLVTWYDEKSDNYDLTVRINGKIVFSGNNFGCEEKEYTRLMDHEDFFTTSFFIPEGIITDSTAYLEMNETSIGVMFAEIRFISA